MASSSDDEEYSSLAEEVRLLRTLMIQATVHGFPFSTIGKYTCSFVTLYARRVAVPLTQKITVAEAYQ